MIKADFVRLVPVNFPSLPLETPAEFDRRFAKDVFGLDSYYGGLVGNYIDTNSNGTIVYQPFGGFSSSSYNHQSQTLDVDPAYVQVEIFKDINGIPLTIGDKCWVAKHDYFVKAEYICPVRWKQDWSCTYMLGAHFWNIEYKKKFTQYCQAGVIKI